MKLRELTAAMLASTVLVMPFSALDITAADETVVVFSTFNIAGVTEGSALVTTFTPDVDIEVFSILTYHWNSGSGSPAGTISVYEGEELIGTWQAVGSKGMYNTPDANWTCYPSGLVLKAEHTYSFRDSDPNTWSYNSVSDGYGFVEIRTGTDTKVGITPSDSEKGEQKIFEGHTYQRFDTPSNWDEANAYCKAQGGHLATITSQEEQNAVASTISDGNMDVYWLGATAFDCVPEWITGEEFVYNNFAEGQPDNAFEGYHVDMQKTPMNGLPQYSWGDTDAAGEYFGLDRTGFICEWDEAAASDEITVTFDAGDGTVEPAEMKAKTGSIYGALPIPVLEGLEFQSWALGEGGSVAMNVVDYYGTPIVRLSPYEDDTGWDGETPTMFREGYTIVFDMTMNDAIPTGLDINDNDIDSSRYTIDGNRIYGAIKVDSSCYRSNFSFVDIHTNNLCENYTLNTFFISSTDDYMVTSESVVTATEDHTLHAVWKKNNKNALTPDVLIDSWELYKVVSAETGEEIPDGAEDFKGWIYTYCDDGVYSVDKGDGSEQLSYWKIVDNELRIYKNKEDTEYIILTYDGTDISYSSEGVVYHFRKTDEEYALGDPNNDGKIDAKDASLILVEYSKASTGAESGFNESQRLAGEVNGDGKIDAKDASAVLAYYALVSTATDDVPTLKDFVSDKAK